MLLKLIIAFICSIIIFSMFATATYLMTSFEPTRNVTKRIEMERIMMEEQLSRRFEGSSPENKDVEKEFIEGILKRFNITRKRHKLKLTFTDGESNVLEVEPPIWPIKHVDIETIDYIESGDEVVEKETKVMKPGKFNYTLHSYPVLSSLSRKNDSNSSAIKRTLYSETNASSSFDVKLNDSDEVIQKKTKDKNPSGKFNYTLDSYPVRSSLSKKRGSKRKHGSNSSAIKRTLYSETNTSNFFNVKLNDTNFSTNSTFIENDNSSLPSNVTAESSVTVAHSKKVDKNPSKIADETIHIKNEESIIPLNLLDDHLVINTLEEYKNITGGSHYNQGNFMTQDKSPTQVKSSTVNISATEYKFSDADLVYFDRPYENISAAVDKTATHNKSVIVDIKSATENKSVTNVFGTKLSSVDKQYDNNSAPQEKSVTQKKSDTEDKFATENKSATGLQFAIDEKSPAQNKSAAEDKTVSEKKSVRVDKSATVDKTAPEKKSAILDKYATVVKTAPGNKSATLNKTVSDEKSASMDITAPENKSATVDKIVSEQKSVIVDKSATVEKTAPDNKSATVEKPATVEKSTTQNKSATVDKSKTEYKYAVEDNSEIDFSSMDKQYDIMSAEIMRDDVDDSFGQDDSQRINTDIENAVLSTHIGNDGQEGSEPIYGSS